MKKIIFIAIASTSLCYSQKNIADVLFSTSTTAIELTSITGYNLSELNLMKENIEIPDGFTEYPCIKHLCENIDTSSYRYYKKYDISGDGINDLIYSTYCGTEEYQNFLWIRIGKKFKFCGLYIGEIMRIVRRYPFEPCSFFLRTGYCCAGYIGDYTFYEPILNKQHIAWEPVRTFQEYDDTEIPSKLIYPIPFVITEAKYRLRESPIIIDSLDNEKSSRENRKVFGNILAEYPKGCTGLTFAEHKGADGRIWWFVIMDKSDSLSYDRFYGGSRTYKCGWMSSKYLKLLN